MLLTIFRQVPTDRIFLLIMWSESALKKKLRIQSAKYGAAEIKPF